MIPPAPRQRENGPPGEAGGPKTSELQTQSESDLTLTRASVPGSGPDGVRLAKGGAVDVEAVVVRVAPVRVIEHVEELRAEFDAFPVARERERAEEREVQVPRSRPAELVSARVAQRHPGRLTENGRVEEGARVAVLVEHGVRPVQVCRLTVARHVEIGPVGRNRERCPRVGAV